MSNKIHGQISPNDIQKRKESLGKALEQAQRKVPQIKNTNATLPTKAKSTEQSSVGMSQINTATIANQKDNNVQQPAVGNSNPSVGTAIEDIHNVAKTDQNAQIGKILQARASVPSGTVPANVTVTATPNVPKTQQTSTPAYLYDSNTDYSKLINQAVAAGNYQQAAIYEQQRNAKIAAEGLNYAQTDYYADYLPGGAKYGEPSYVYSYDNNVDYSNLINNAIAAGNFYQAAIYEQQRNAKIAGEGLPYEQTNKYAEYLPGGSKYGTVQIVPNDMSPLINQMYDAQAQQIKNQLNYETQGAVDQLNRALQDAQPTFEAAIANQLLETKQAQDAQALRNQVNGDRGGIGSAQVSSIGNTGAKNREAIAQQQRQLATDTARQIADLRAQGKYQEANLLLQNAQQKLSALYEEQVRLQQQEAEQKNILVDLGSQYLSAGLMPSDEMLAAMGIDAATAQKYMDFYATQLQNQKDSESKNILLDLGSQYLSAGLMPSDDMLAAMGIDAATAQLYIDLVNGQKKTGGTGGYVGSGNPTPDDPDDPGDPVFQKINGMDELGPTAKNLVRGSNYDSYDAVAPTIFSSIDRGFITFNEAVYVAYVWMSREGYNVNNDEEFARQFYNSYMAYKEGAFDE